MKKIIPLIIFICLLGNACEKQNESIKQEAKIVKHGVVIIDGKAEYIDPSKVYSSMERTDEYVEQIYNKGKRIISAYEVCWFSRENKVGVYNGRFGPYGVKHPIPISKGKMIFNYKIKNNSLYLYKDGERDSLSVSITRDEPYVKNNLEYYMHVYLKCKWFEGEYAITAEHLKHRKGDL